MDGPPDDDGAVTVAAAPALPQKRDEWSESGIVRLLEAYEAKWLLRNRAKLKWSDWVDIAHQVSSHCSERMSKPGNGKTPNQCKNKIESMKKRYRAESAAAARAGSAASGPSWRFFARMDGLLKGPANCSAQLQVEFGPNIDLRAPAKPEVEADAVDQLQDAGAGILSDMLNIDANGGAADKVDNSRQKESRGADSDVNMSSPRSKEANEDIEEVDKMCDPWRKRKGSECEIAKGIELLASSFLKIEQARMEMYREAERMRLDAEIRRGEMELKRTEIVAKTQLQIAKLFVKRLKGSSNKTGGSSSLSAAVDILTKKGGNAAEEGSSPAEAWRPAKHGVEADGGDPVEAGFA